MGGFASVGGSFQQVKVVLGLAECRENSGQADPAVLDQQLLVGRADAAVLLMRHADQDARRQRAHQFASISESPDKPLVRCSSLR